MEVGVAWIPNKLRRVTFARILLRSTIEIVSFAELLVLIENVIPYSIAMTNFRQDRIEVVEENGTGQFGRVETMNAGTSLSPTAERQSRTG
jgi:hypothetical protein